MENLTYDQKLDFIIEHRSFLLFDNVHLDELYKRIVEEVKIENIHLEIQARKGNSTRCVREADFYLTNFNEIIRI